MPWVQHTFFFGRNKFTWPSGAREVSRVGKSDRKSARPETRNLRGGLRNGDLLRLKPFHEHRENGADRAGGGLELVAEIPRNGGVASNGMPKILDLYRCG